MVTSKKIQTSKNTKKKFKRYNGTRERVRPRERFGRRSSRGFKHNWNKKNMQAIASDGRACRKSVKCCQGPQRNVAPEERKRRASSKRGRRREKMNKSDTFSRQLYPNPPNRLT